MHECQYLLHKVYTNRDFVHVYRRLVQAEVAASMNCIRKLKIENEYLYFLYQLTITSIEIAAIILGS